MKILLSTINAKYIHTSLALRWLLVANQSRFDLSIKEFTLKQEVEKIAEEILSIEIDVLGLGVYIWNVAKTAELVRQLKRRKPGLKIILGGPEVTYEPEYFLKNWPVDYIISGEGEFILGELLEAIRDNKDLELDGVSSQQKTSKTVVKADLHALASLPSPYKLPQDQEDVQHKIVYFETSRGCPYQCDYCLSSLEKGVRYFPNDYLFENLQHIIQSKARQIKFLDRTFNLNPKHAQQLFQFLIAHHRPGLKCQFEIYADLLDDSIISYLNELLPEKYFRFEIGIQSTHTPTNLAVNRKQDFEKLSGNIQKLMNGLKIDLHLDLIAGLPFESLERLKNSFDDVFKWKVKEIQLGFLKLLRGTGLRKNAEKYGYIYDLEAPYQIKSNHDLSEKEIKKIIQVEHMLDIYWNSGRFKQTLHTLFETTYKDRYFEFFDELGEYYLSQTLSLYGYQLEDIYRNLHAFLLTKNIHLLQLLKSDYYRNFTTRPAGFWPSEIDKKTTKHLLYQIGNDKEFLSKYNLTRKIVEKRAVIDYVPEDQYLLTFFLIEKSNVIITIPYHF